jgi:FKBP-type peptidyl-prolyl cis-trans isomerase SlyD
VHICKNKVVTFTFILKDDQGNILDKTEDEPTRYVHGYQHIMPILEEALEGKVVNEKVSVFIPFEKAYGKRESYLIRKVSRAQFSDPNLKIGMKVYSPENERFKMRVIEVDDDFVTLDANHPLAGISLQFEIEIQKIRDATEQEIPKNPA